MVQLSLRITCLENKVHQALAVMNTDTGKLLNYRQLIRSAKHKKVWSLSSGKRHWWQNKELHQHHQVIFKHKVPTEQKRDVVYGQFVCTV